MSAPLLALSGGDVDAAELERYRAEIAARAEAEGRRESRTALGKDPGEWSRAREFFPRVPFPWRALPPATAKSLQQLARSCATSPLALPGAAVAIFSSLLGRTVKVYPKGSWDEPLTFWFTDIRNSGDGKTHAVRMLCSVHYQAQGQADALYLEAMKKWEEKPQKERGEKPQRARGYFITDLTLEGLRDDISGHGGVVCVMDEISSFIGSQNQYKKGGNDRESWLSLHDGKPARIVRVGKSVTIAGACVNLFGGIQPSVWRRVFGGDSGLYVEDGTVYRLLCTFVKQEHIPRTKEVWSAENREAWETLLKRAMRWADEQTLSDGVKTQKVNFPEEVQDRFLEWVNRMDLVKLQLPAQLRGFIPKMVGYSVRLAGAIHCMHRFSENLPPADAMTTEEMERGILMAEFYMGHLVDAMHALVSDESAVLVPMGEEEKARHLAECLEGLRAKLDSGRLAVGFVWESYNRGCKPEIRLNTEKAMGSLLRACGITVKTGMNANGRRGVSCLIWGEETEKFLETHKQSPPSPQCPPGQDYQGSCPADVENPKSAMSAGDSGEEDEKRTWRTLETPKPAAGSRANTGPADMADIADMVSGESGQPREEGAI